MYINKLLAIRIIFFNSRLNRDSICNFANRYKNYCMLLDYKHVQSFLHAYHLCYQL